MRAILSMLTGLISHRTAPPHASAFRVACARARIAISAPFRPLTAILSLILIGVRSSPIALPDLYHFDLMENPCHSGLASLPPFSH